MISINTLRVVPSLSILLPEDFCSNFRFHAPSRFPGKILWRCHYRIAQAKMVKLMYILLAARGGMLVHNRQQKAKKETPMSDLVVIAFEDEFTAEEVRTKLMKLQRDYLVDVEDAVVAVKKADGKVRLNQIHNLTATGAISGSFWGLLIGLIFFSPVLGAAVGAAAGAITGTLADIGISDEFMKELSKTLQPRTSALFILIRKATSDKVLEELTPYNGKVLQTSLSHRNEAALKAALSKITTPDNTA